MTTDHDACHFSTTIYTKDEAVLHMLRGLSYYAESGRRPQIASGGTGSDDWKDNGFQATFRFSAPEYRKVFMSEATRLLPAGSWAPVSTNDNDPATPRR
jgi:hypothetical protein